MFEKLVNSRINEIADWIIRIIMINVMIIFFSLAVVTIYPAICAGYDMFHDYIDKKNPRLFKDYFRHFKEKLGRKILVELIILVVFALFYLNIRYYDLSLGQQTSTFLWIGYYISLGLIAIWFAMMLYSIIVFHVHKNLKLINFFKLSFFLAGKYYFITLALVVITFAPFLLVLYHTALTSLLFIFTGISIPLVLNVLMTRRVTRYLESLGKQNG